MKRWPVTAHLSADEVGDGYRRRPAPQEKTRWHLVWLLLRDDALACERAGPLVGLSDTHARTVLRRWNAGGPDGRIDGRKRNRSAGQLTAAQQAEAFDAPRRNRPTAACGPVPSWPGTPATGGGSRCAPRPAGGGSRNSASGWWCPVPGTPRRPARANSGGGFDHLESTLAEWRRANPTRPVELWCEDEARVGLKAAARRVWALTGTRPTRCGRQRFESLYVYGFARPATGRNRCLFLPKANAERTGEARAAFAAWADPGGEKVLVVRVDHAGGHTAKKLVVPANVRLHPLPACTPALQPAERRWPLVRGAVANRTFDHLVGLAAKLRRRCDYLAGHPEVVKGAVGFHWAAKH